ncbi:hypothetical protein RHMOL_Rhmol10G0213100 [Rhododendron molle]|uniref:Uncharacterized protein n=1 Tax=Rhododendron molle TaxID=49168 RepID=A0ACC0M578_RHOML|nr:hypothetical protein RHMOL_Rhmol10G0213100 [Rhododendron molle]
MKPLSPKLIFLFSSRSLSTTPALPISRFSTSSSPPPSFPARRHEEESRGVRVSVWWDFENCQLPAGANVFKVGQSIAAAVRANGIKGPVQITAFGDMLQLSRSFSDFGGKNSADRSLLVDLMYWVSQNPPPAHLFLISGDRDFAGTLHRLRLNNYNILLASPETAPSVLCSAASIMWNWNALVKGENLTGKYFNQPPDGPYGSWYGHYRVPLEDPFAVTEQPACSRAEEVSELNSDLKLRPVPKAVVKLICHILKSNPKGISISELGSELKRSNLGIEKDLYGYKKFSRFLASMPHILKLESRNDGQHLVIGVASKVPEQDESIPGLIATGSGTNAEGPLIATSPKVNGKDSSGTKCTDGNQMLPPTPEVNAKEPSKISEESQMKVPETPPLAERGNNANETDNHLHSSEGYNSKPEVGFFKMMWRKWFAGADAGSENTSSGIQEKRTPGESTEKPQTEEKSVKSICQTTDLVGPASFSSSHKEAVMDDKLVGGDEAQGELSSRDPHFFKQIISWCKFWRKSRESESSSKQSSENLNQVTIDSGKHEVFLKESFWKEMEAYIDTPPNGSVLVLQSKSREQMAQNLQKHGPSALRSLTQCHLLHLVDLLISEKRWVEECPSQTYPFKLNRPCGNSSTSTNHPNSNGLLSIFLRTSQSPQQRILEHEREIRHQNPLVEVSPPFFNKKPHCKSRNDILADCHKLVDELVVENPEGFNMGFFRKQFLDRYGYPLDIQKLGYQKLATLIQIMPGVKIESSYIVPCNVAKSSRLETPVQSALADHVSCPISNSDGEISDASSESPWAELGPVAKMGPTRNVKDLGSKSSGPKHDYETLSDDYVSDSDDDTSLIESETKPKKDDEDSSLLRILDSWYSSEEEANRKEGRDSVDGMVDCSQNVLDPSDSSGAGSKVENQAANCGRKPRSVKSYSFVTDPAVDNNKDKLIDGILTSLKKSGESRIQV